MVHTPIPYRGVQMKNRILGAGLIVCISLLAACSAVSEDVSVVPGATEVINDVLKSEQDFNFDTVSVVEIRMGIQSTAHSPLQGALVTVYNAEGQAISYAFSDSKGLALFSVTTPNDEGDATIVVTHPQITAYTSQVDNLAQYQTIDRSLTVVKGIAPPVIIDTDQDGVPDDQDDFPDDARYAKAIRGQYTLVYEDLYPVKGDADFNDAVTTMTFEERINVSNEVAAVIVTAQALASGAGYDNQLFINIMGQEYPLILSYKADLASKFNSKEDPADAQYIPAAIIRTNQILLDVPVMRHTIQPMPYDPFLVPNGNQAVPVDTNGNRQEVHLPFVNTDYSGIVIDEDGFPWAMVVPMDFLWPYERNFITNAYPKFKSWYESNGKMDMDWYNYPVDGEVYPR